MTLTERRGLILKAVVEEYVRNGQPVGSRAIVRRYGLDISPATVRNELARLSEEGFVVQPHTSAGRAPSDRGYRFYVDNLMSPYDLGAAEEIAVRRYLNACSSGIRDAVRGTARLLADVTSYVAVVLAPELGAGRVEGVHLLPVAEARALLIVVLEGGFVQHKLIELPGSIEPEDLEYLSRQLDAAFRGCAVDDLPRAVAALWRSSMARYGAVLELAANALLESLHPGDQDQERIYLGGTTNILRLPEFQDVERLREVLGLLEEEALLMDILTARTSGAAVQVTIGRENPSQAMRECSLVTATYRVPGGGTGLLGLLGPTRMDYRRVTAVLDAVRMSLDGLLGD
ncbi:MAG: heat-inducible transcription repressor HrcA [Firmicutes bacterium RBG_13_65_8]|nr:MAG: heat-inducible transcription repressor HrcA [Firmicutes bacterium RBG_13_65_8]